MVATTSRHILFLIVLLIAGALPMTAIAQEEAATPSSDDGSNAIQIILRPVDGLDGERFEVELEPGNSQTLTVVIGNAGNEMLKVFSYTSDIRTRINGGLALSGAESEQHEPTTWIDYPLEDYELEPGTEVHREFALTVPEGTLPGEYVIPLAVETRDSFAIEGSEQIRQKLRKIIPIYVTVPGDLKSEFSYGVPSVEFLPRGMNIQVPLVNTGDKTLRLEGTLTVMDPTGGVLVEAPVKMGALYRKQETLVQTTISTTLPPADYTVSLDLTDSISGVSLASGELALAIGEPEVVEEAPVQFGTIAVEPNGSPIQFANVAVDIVNTGQSLQTTRLTLIVTRDGQPVEEFVLADNLQLPQGTTSVQQRYLPIDGWQSGTYSFSLRYEVTEEGNTALVMSQDDVATVEVP